MCFPRDCKRCGFRFQPNTPSNKLCDTCRAESNRKRQRKIRITKLLGLPNKYKTSERNPKVSIQQVFYRYSCDRCGMKFRLKGTFITHMKEHKKEIDAEKGNRDLELKTR